MPRKKIEFNKLQPENENPVLSNDPESKIEVMDCNNPGWTAYIISHLDESEMFQGVPRLDGLRRLVEQFMGRITKMNVHIQPVHTSVLSIVATATVELDDGTIWSASSDANQYSTQDSFKYRLTAVADNRAKSKVFREILRLKNIQTSEEINASSDLESQDFIIDSQKIAIHNKCKKLGIDVMKLIKFVEGNAIELGMLRTSQAIKIINKLSEMDKTNTVPNSIKLGENNEGNI